ncbi:low temperature requirement protein A [Micromonospora lupini]|uniref:Low temperature requirement A n=1 Tax=Micromonospora lupini str. Lupac 08 TaxID=1150864 RepID=I0L022_9ACTN|nr:low temperature requirement protein A [Micromonospora lupini]CCH17169.1 Low temperature requirement A [Micromonospora lupini str. Lupac 08]
MSRVTRSRPVLVEEAHRATTFEIFFDLVLVFALTRLIDFLAESLSPLTLYQGLLLLLWFWYAWSCYTWLGNQVRADRGVVTAGMTVAMAAIFVAALVIPEAWQRHDAAVSPPLILAVAYAVVRGLHLALMVYASSGNPQYRRQTLRFAASTTLAWVPLFAGAVLGGSAETVLWTVAFLVDYGGGRVATAASFGEVRSGTHFAERHGLVLIIVLGESLLSAGGGAGSRLIHWPVLVAALLGFAATVCLWRLYFVDAAPAAARALAEASPRSRHRQRLASDAYTLAHLPLVAGVLSFALGLHLVLASAMGRAAPGHGGGVPLEWLPTSVLYGGVALYLVGRFLFLRLTVSTSPAPLVAIGILLLLAPLARFLPALAALGLLTALLIALVCYERLTWRVREA